MGRKMFNADIAGELARQLGPKVLRMVLVTVTPGDEIPGHLSAGSDPILNSHNCKGWIEDYTDYSNASVVAGDKKISILGDTIKGGAIPKPEDFIDFDDVRYRIVGPVKSDPDLAVYTCHCRGKATR